MDMKNKGKKDYFLLKISEARLSAEFLTGDEFKELVLGIADYVETGEVPTTLSEGVRRAFQTFKNTEDAHRERYEEICRERAEAGRKGGLVGGAPKGNQNARKHWNAEDEGEN